ncbi:MAG: hypothetical protein WD100_01825, partial [Tistlia sp.]
MTEPSPLAHLIEAGPDAVPIRTLSEAALRGWLAGQSAALRAWLEATGFTASAGSHALVPGGDGRLSLVLLGVEAGPGRDPTADLWAYGGLPASLPQGSYRLAEEPSPEAA